MVAKNVQRHDTLKTMRQVSLPEVLRRARGTRSLREMARETGLAVNSIKLLEDGVTSVPKRETVPALAQAYGIEEDVIVRSAYGLYFEDEPAPRPLADSPASKEAVPVS